MKKLCSFILVIFAAITMTITCFAKTNEPLDEIVAIVNDDVVTKSELNRSLIVTRHQIMQQQISMPADNVLKKQVLNQLINKKLQLQIAKQVGIDFTDADVDRVVQNVARQNNLSVNSLYERINHDGMGTEDYRGEIRDQMIVQKLQQQEVGSRLSVSTDEITSFMNSKLWQNNNNKEYHLEDILISLSDTPSSEEISRAKKQAQSIVTKLNQGQSFHEIAQQESGDNHALNGGDLGWRKLAEIPSAFAQQIVMMQTNDIAGPIQTPNGFHIIRLVAERGAKDAAPNRTQVEQLLLQRKFEEHVQNWVAKMRGQAFISMNIK